VVLEGFAASARLKRGRMPRLVCGSPFQATR